MTSATPRAVAAEPGEAEARIAEAVARRDFAAAATSVIQAYGPQVLGYLRALVKDDAEADDAFALFAEHVWRGLPTWQGRASARAWAYRVAWNAAGRIFRDPWHRRRRRLSSGAASRLAAAVLTSARRDQDRRQDELTLLRGILTPEEQSLLVLRIDRGMTWGEVAVAMDLPADAAGRAALRKRFERLKVKLASSALARGLLPEG